jgi:exonuclease III
MMAHCNSMMNLFSSTTLNKRRHPQRLKIIIWTVFSIVFIRKLLNIEKSVLMRKRGNRDFKRIEVWCESRKTADNLYNKSKLMAKLHNIHISYGTTIDDRKRKLKNSTLPNVPNQEVTIMQWNARSLNNKIGEFKEELENSSTLIACIQESNITTTGELNTNSIYMNIPLFKSYSLNRVDRKGGGVATYIHESLPVLEYKKEMSQSMEIIFTKVKISNQTQLSIVNIYIPPSAKVTIEDLNKIIPNDKLFLIIGDFNAKHHTWNKGPSNPRGKIVFEWISQNNIHLINVEKTPTYQCASSGRTSTIDLTIVSNKLMSFIKQWKVGEDLQSDHFPVYTILSFGTNVER